MKSVSRSIEEMKQNPQSGFGWNIDYYKIPARWIETICAEEEIAIMAVVLRLFYLAYREHRYDNLKLATVNIGGFKLTKWQKSRALQKLKGMGLVTYKQENGNRKL